MSIGLKPLSYGSCSQILDADAFLRRPSCMSQAFKGIKSLIVSTIFNALTPKSDNPLWPGIGYEGPDPERPLAPNQERLKAEAVLQQAMLDLTDSPCKTPEDFLDFMKATGKAHAGPGVDVRSFLSLNLWHSCLCFSMFQQFHEMTKV